MAPRAREHLSQKPVEVMRELVQITPAGGTVLDPFMGAGTTGVAAVIEGRRFVGVESTEHFCAVAERRIRQAAGEAIAHGDQLALPLAAG
jgi:site-specific DNA-methyltransferase (adenine-specific)